MCRDILRSGYKIVYEPEAMVLHGHERSLYSEFQWALDNAISLTRMGILGQKEQHRANCGTGSRASMPAILLPAAQILARASEYISTNAVRWLGAQLGKRKTCAAVDLAKSVSRSASRLNVRRSAMFAYSQDRFVPAMNMLRDATQAQ